MIGRIKKFLGNPIANLAHMIARRLVVYILLAVIAIVGSLWYLADHYNAGSSAWSANYSTPTPTTISTTTPTPALTPKAVASAAPEQATGPSAADNAAANQQALDQMNQATCDGLQTTLINISDKDMTDYQTIVQNVRHDIELDSSNLAASLGGINDYVATSNNNLETAYNQLAGEYTTQRQEFNCSWTFNIFQPPTLPYVTLDNYVTWPN